MANKLREQVALIFKGEYPHKVFFSDAEALDLADAALAVVVKWLDEKAEAAGNRYDRELLCSLADELGGEP